MVSSEDSHHAYSHASYEHVDVGPYALRASHELPDAVSEWSVLISCRSETCSSSSLGSPTPSFEHIERARASKRLFLTVPIWSATA